MKRSIRDLPALLIAVLRLRALAACDHNVTALHTQVTMHAILLG